ncbi:MAG: hypothetical protein DMG30_10900 [Acidobacteria bacterium]|nr:MAG: hypothetical protein DMG30_10900 [Acidobacteriota bacterium]
MIRHTPSARFTAPVLRVDWRVHPPAASCAHAGAIHAEKTGIATAAYWIPKVLRDTGDPEMISPARFLSFIAFVNLCWLECAQNPAAFCYRIGWDLLAPFWQSRAAGTHRRHVRTNPQPSS